MENAPIIRMEMPGMKQTICKALSNHAAQMDEDIKMAVEKYCTNENIRNVIENAARETLNLVIKQEVESFFRYGEGRKQVAASVKESILKKKTFTPIDDV